MVIITDLQRLFKCYLVFTMRSFFSKPYHRYKLHKISENIYL